MKKLLLILLAVPALFIATSCGEESKMKLEGDQSPMGEVGTRFSGDFAGGSDFNLSVKSLDNGISTVEGTFTMTDPRYKKILKSLPKYCDVNGDKVVNNQDVSLLLRYLANIPVTIEIRNADVTGDNVINGKDALRLMKYVSGQSVTLE